MEDIYNTPCAYRGCSKRSRYGTTCSRSAKFCREHKGVGMVDLTHKSCAYHGCTVRPSYGRVGSRTGEFCSEHKREDMVDVVNKRCGHHGCFKRSSFGQEGSKNAKFCSEHKMAGMVDVKNKRCAQQGCSTRPSFGKESSGEVEFCRKHKVTGMVNLLHDRCTREGCSKLAVYGLDGSTRERVLCARHFTKGDQGADTNELKEKAGEQVALRISRKRAVRVDRIPRKVQKTSGDVDRGPSRAKRMRGIGREKRDPSREPRKMSTPVRETSAVLSKTGFTPIASHGGCHQSRETQKLCRDDRATSRARRRSMGSECGRDSTRDLAPHSGVAAATPPNCVPPESVARSNTEEPEFMASTRTTGSAGGVQGCGGGEGSVSAGNGDALITSRPAGARSDVSSVSSLQCSYSSASSAFIQDHRHKIASLENDKREAEIEVSALVRKIASLEQENREAVLETANLRDKLDLLENKVADDAVGSANAEARARKETEQEFTHIVQGLRDELGAASNTLKDCNSAYEAVCEERKALREQVSNVRAQVASAASKFEAQANMTKKAEEGFQRRIEVLRAALSGASTGWQKTKDELKEVYLKREALQEEVTKTQAEVASAVSKFKAESAEKGKAKEVFHQRIEEMRGELTAALKGWEGTKSELKHICQERDALHQELQEQVAFDADIVSKVAVKSSALGHRMKSIKSGPSTANQREAEEMVSTIASGPQIPASLLQTMMTGLATVASPAAFAAACAVAQSSGGAPASDPQTPPADRPQRRSVDGVVDKRQFDDNIGLCELEHERAEELAELPQGCLDISTVAIKPEG